MGKTLAKSGIKIALETTPGTRIAPSSVIYTEELTIVNPEYLSQEYSKMGMYSGNKKKIFFKDWAKVDCTIKQPLSKDITIIEDLLLASNLQKIVGTDKNKDSKNDIIYKPHTIGAKTLSVDITTPREQFQLKGAKSNFKLSGEEGNRINIEFTMQGALETIIKKTDKQVDFSLPVASDINACIFSSSTALTANNNTVNITSFELDMANEIKHIRSSESNEFLITDFNPILKFKVRRDEKTDSGYDELIAGTTLDIVIDIADINGVVIYKLYIPKAKMFEAPNNEDDEGLMVTEKTYYCEPTAGDDNFELVVLGV